MQLYNTFIDQVDPATGFTYCPGVGINGTKVGGGQSGGDNTVRLLS